MRGLLLLLAAVGFASSRRRPVTGQPSRTSSAGAAGAAAGAGLRPGGAIVEADPIPLGRLVEGSYENTFGGRAQQHAAQDMPAPAGTSVYSPVTGTVLPYGRSYPGQAGLSIRATATGLEHSLGHLAAASIQVRPGERVTAGQPLAVLNDVAWSPPSSRAAIADLEAWFQAPPHLHYRIRDPRIPRDPSNRAVGTINPYPYLLRLRAASRV